MSRPRSTPRVRIRMARPWFLSAASIALGVALVSCQGLGGEGGSPVPYDQLRGGLDAAYAGVEQAIAAGSFDQVSPACDALRRELDRVEEATKRWGILEREKLKLQVATARRGLQAVVRAAPVSGDAELLQAELRPVGEAVREVSALLAQAAASAPRASS